MSDKIYLEACEILTDVKIDTYSFVVTLNPLSGNSCILWHKDERISDAYEGLGRFSCFDKARVLNFIVRFATNSHLREDIQRRKFETKLKKLSPLFFEKFENMPEKDKRKYFQQLFDLDHIIIKRELVKRRRIMAKRFHPDRGGTNRAMSVINEAYQFLMDRATN